MRINAFNDDFLVENSAMLTEDTRKKLFRVAMGHRQQHGDWWKDPTVKKAYARVVGTVNSVVSSPVPSGSQPNAPPPPPPASAAAGAAFPGGAILCDDGTPPSAPPLFRRDSSMARAALACAARAKAKVAPALRTHGTRHTRHTAHDTPHTAHRTPHTVHA